MQLHSSAFEQVAAVIEHIITNFDPNLCCSIGNILFPTPFDAVEVPEISVKDYLGRIREYSRCSESCYVIAFIYIDRLLQNNPGFLLSKLNIHRLILSTVILAAKYSEDEYVDNATFSKIGGIPLPELNLLEAYTLILLHYNLRVTTELYYQYLHELELLTLCH
eukprot:TRINITY_DN3874_c0_g1_i8.p1 TRINITY_DN3874_c0_g1~~TRINITY_DN3874_c0_g1_i8.p1  ORF type:complete len:164 (-),score=11.17 TRINITY_DN3874_c0_g1_i8:137-628(-)